MNSNVRILVYARKEKLDLFPPLKFDSKFNMIRAT